MEAIVSPQVFARWRQELKRSPLRLGDRRTRISSEVKTYLRFLGYQTDRNTDKFTRTEKHSVFKFQRDYSLLADGVVGIQTITALRLLYLSYHQVGKRYIFAHEVNLDDPNPKAFDCSELTEWLYHWCGSYLPDGSSNQFTYTSPSRDIFLGDLLFKKSLLTGKISHVAVCLGRKRVLEAKGRLFGVVITPYSSFVKSRNFAGIRRVENFLHNPWK